jgi:hypothetical protein
LLDRNFTVRGCRLGTTTAPEPGWLPQRDVAASMRTREHGWSRQVPFARARLGLGYALLMRIMTTLATGAALVALTGCGTDDGDEGGGGRTGGTTEPQSEFDDHPLCPTDGASQGYACSEEGYDVPEYAHLPVQLERTNQTDLVGGGTVEAIETAYGEQLMTGELFTTQAHPDCPDRIFILMYSVGSIVVDIYFDFNLNGVFEVHFIDADMELFDTYPIPDC